jgi:cytochrome c-type protein NapB
MLSLACADLPRPCRRRGKPPKRPSSCKSLRGAEINASDPEGDGTRYGRDLGAPAARLRAAAAADSPHHQGLHVTKKFNKCLDCHAWVARQGDRCHQDLGHPLQVREGQELSSVSPNRYFCNQCHVPQSDAKPLVGNTFKPGTGMR